MTDVMLDDEFNPILLRGVAVPYLDYIEVDGERERFDVAAFAKQARRGFQNIPLQWQHERQRFEFASTGNGTLEIFNDVTGLLFQARLAAHPESLGILQILRRELLGCSIQFGGEFKKTANDTIVEAKLQHIGLALHGASCYRTAAWVEDSTNRRRISSIGAEAMKWRKALERHLRWQER